MPGPIIDHAFLPDTWGRDVCDARVDEQGRVRMCGRRRREHGQAAAEEQPTSIDELARTETAPR